MTSLLVELQTEELPPKALKKLSEAFGRGIEKSLRGQGLLSGGSRSEIYATPRRLAVHITDVLPRSEDKPFSKKLMPKAIGFSADGKPSAPLLKKMEALGLGKDLSSLRTKQENGKEFLYVEGKLPGVELAAGLEKAVGESCRNLPIPRVMSYQLPDGVTTVEFVRPVRYLTALYGEQIVPISLFGLESGRTTRGHRFMAPPEMEIASADSYASQMREAFVMVSYEERRAKLVELLHAKAKELGGTPIMPEGLIDEVTALTEWPVVYSSSFEKEFLSVPEECLILTMQLNQKYFPLRDASGRLMNQFLLVSQLVARDGGKEISSGNARVVRARLADAKFFYETDQKETLASRVPGLSNVVYHAKLGSQLERMERVRAIAGFIAMFLHADAEKAARAAYLAKADLRTQMVGEFPELQGIMGQYYALHDGEPAEVALAIREHYLPRFAGDRLPSTPISIAVAMADKLDTLGGMFGIGQAPTGEKDPYALRRHAISVLRMLIEKQIPAKLTKILELTYEVERHVQGVGDFRSELASFFYDRLRVMFKDAGYTAQELEAVLAPRPDLIMDIPARLKAVRSFEALPEAEALAGANKRISNILKKAQGAAAPEVRPELLADEAEKKLFAAIEEVRPKAEADFASGAYEAMLSRLAALKAPVDEFFEKVMVNAEDPQLRSNRLALLQKLHGLMNQVAELSRLAK
ncbi:glycine--tRNA ligase subunit beta [Mesosutterella sp. AGMB02718]|uniref:Glycine--tRNA ligase beta subunit n=1 Tax=Mesosutterella faecium TaxID=2925194 RepID=A0ABT7IKS2_9BURK|nr:glycine--tRNA ligase subunit beta [Mesosutterella sp. AGMB02718]MDL2058964.1 glycine--tRNA ligase subunit beta [Mesosutterella sp. AGMB02718]